MFKREGVSYGSFMRMKTLAMKKLRRTLMPPMKSSRKRLSLGMLGALERSRMMKPRPPMVKRKLEASPSMMYWPLTLENTSAEFRGWSQSSGHHRQGQSSEEQPELFHLCLQCLTFTCRPEMPPVAGVHVHPSSNQHLVAQQ